MSADVLPKHRSVSVYKREFAKSIFLRKVGKDVTTIKQEVKTSDFGKGWFLEGLVEDGLGGITVFIIDENQKIITAPSDEYKIVNSNMPDTPKDASVTLSNGTDQVTLKFRDNPLRRVRLNSKSRSQRPNEARPQTSKIANPITAAASAQAKEAAKPVETQNTEIESAESLLRQNDRTSGRGIVLPKPRN